MLSVLGCRVPAPVLAAWSRHFVLEREPLYMTPDACGLLPRGTLLFTREEFGANHVTAPLEMRDSYGLYGLGRDATHVALVSPAEMRSLPEGARRDLMRLQWRLGRGHIYDPAEIGEASPLLDSCCFDTPDGVKVALRYDLWRSLDRSARQRLLLRFVTQDRTDCLSSRLDAETWRRLTDRHGPFIRRLAGTFAAASGPNCLATALAGATRSPETATFIASLWLHQEPFLRALSDRGLRLRPLPDAPPPGSFIVWQDANGVIQHSCYVLGEGVVLNKDAQSWFAPRQILPLQSVIDHWSDDGLTAMLYT